MELTIRAATPSTMLAGSLFGWGAPAADPENYDAQGRPIRPMHREREDAR